VDLFVLGEAPCFELVPNDPAIDVDAKLARLARHNVRHHTVPFVK
jgi:hypothetical protein